MRRLALAWALLAAAVAANAFDPVTPGRPIRFPEDAGAHPGHRVEWWYVTGHLETRDGPLGFQVTFFRLRHRESPSNPSRFAAPHILFAHAALSDPRKGALLHDERIARELPPLVEARVGDTAARIDDWTLAREGRAYVARIPAQAFTLELAFTPTQPPLLQGDRGFSRKGPKREAASYYYSEPQLRVGGHVVVDGKRVEVSGKAWLDHEWSSEYLADEAAGWDWVGVNLDDGGALMAFRMRGKDGAPIWAAATIRAPDAEPRTFGPQAVQFTARRQWKSPRTGAAYPVAMDLVLERRSWRIEPVAGMDDQELDARLSTGTVYWEGAVHVTGPNGATGRGYLELTGYGERLPF